MRFGFIFLVILLQLSLPFQFQRHINEIKSSNRDWIQMGLPNPFRAAKNLLGLADWRNVNIGTETRQILTRSDLEERAQFTKESLGPILEGVEDPNLNEDDEMFDTEIEELGPEARAQMIDAPKMADIKVLYKRDEFGKPTGADENCALNRQPHRPN